MLHIICAEQQEADRLKIESKNVKIHVTGAGLFNVLRYPRIDLGPEDIILNIGYAGSNLFNPSDVFSVVTCKRFKPSKTIKEEKQYLFPFYFLGADCYPADDFIESATGELPLIDMELYYLALMYPSIRSVKIVSDNLNYKQFKNANFEKSWELVNKAIRELINE